MSNPNNAPVNLMELPISFELDSDGKLHLFFETDVVIHYKNKSEEISGSSLEFIKENSYTITGGFIHMNPWGGSYYDVHLKQLHDNSDIRDIMAAKQEAYQKEKKQSLYKSLKERLMYRNYNYLRRKKCKCND